MLLGQVRRALSFRSRLESATADHAYKTTSRPGRIDRGRSASFRSAGSKAVNGLISIRAFTWLSSSRGTATWFAETADFTADFKVVFLYRIKIKKPQTDRTRTIT